MEKLLHEKIKLLQVTFIFYGGVNCISLINKNQWKHKSTHSLISTSLNLNTVSEKINHSTNAPQLC
jgi:hypothetical protein